jgi:hypothetical protein
MAEGQRKRGRPLSGVGWRSVLKKRLTEPALLEMSGNGVYQAYEHGKDMTISGAAANS